jgi:hypothetical protein
MDIRKSYIKKELEIAGFTVWVVNGKYIRENIDEDFNNWGQHYHFKFIPKNEFWIDKEHSGGEGEKQFYINSMLTMNKFLSAGISHKKASEIVDVLEKEERAKSAYFKKCFKSRRNLKSKLSQIKKIHKKLLKKYTRGKLSVWIVDGELVRGLYFIDFTQGGHDKVYKFIPKNEIWIDDDVSQKEMKFVLLHEMHERNLMEKGMKYDLAHQFSNAIEFYTRRHRRKIGEFLRKELQNY